MTRIVYTLSALLLFFANNNVQEEEARIWTSLMEKELVNSIARNDLSRGIYAEVVSRLRQDGIPADFIFRTFSHPDIQIESEVEIRFNHPNEYLPYYQYREIFINPERVSKGVKFLHEHESLINAVVDSFGIDPFLLVSIVGIASKYGDNSNQFSIFNALHTIIHKIPSKERWVEREMIEYLEYCYRNFIPPHVIHGSYAGAFGYGQFIPSNFNYFSVDFNGDGVRHAFDWPDVLASIANYLVKNGYVRGSGDFSKNSRNWKAILAFNPLVNYVSVVLELRDELISALKD